MDDQSYREARAGLLGARDDQQKFIDQTVLTLGGGGLGLSLTFLRDIAPPVAAPSLLFLGDVALVLSIIFVLISLHVSQQAFSSYLRGLDDAAFKSFAPGSSSFRGKYVNAAARITQYCNWLASVALTLGIIALTTFVYENESAKITSPVLNMRTRMEKIVIPPTGTGVQRGLVPAPPAVATQPPPPPPTNPPPVPKP